MPPTNRSSKVLQRWSRLSESRMVAYCR